MSIGKDLVLCLLTLASTASLASPLTVTSYTMNNGDLGSYNYRDFTYSPCGGVCDTPQAPLSGGTGKLTDGVSPAVDWINEGPINGITSWVGWDSSQRQPNPVVNFDFAQAVTIDSVTFWLSNTHNGEVALPASISVGGFNHIVAPDDLNTDPRAVTFSGLNLTGPSIDVQFFQNSSYLNSNWVMVGEVSFDGAVAVPEPMTLALLGLGLAGLGFSRRKH
jgi:hypothetical protein